jgi:hypothetical protein
MERIPLAHALGNTCYCRKRGSSEDGSAGVDAEEIIGNDFSELLGGIVMVEHRSCAEACTN